MSYISFSYILLICITTILYFAFPKRTKKYVLLLASMAFYITFGVKALILMLCTALVTFGGAIIVFSADNLKKKKIICALTILIDVLMLVLLKYVTPVREALKLVVPIGISFYTLSAIGYLIDVYRAKYPPCKNILNFLLYIMYFPHILQGPIARYDKLGPQLVADHPFEYERFMYGVQLIVWGFIKKMVIADRLGIFVDNAYQDVYSVRGSLLFVAGLLYCIQLYMDFSGCVDISMGVSEIFGIELTGNFRQPFLAISIQDIWRRWHISLSSWFKDYLYIPLGGNRRGKYRKWLNVLIIFIVSGIWHGVGIGFAIWGILQGVFQILGEILTPLRTKITHFLRIDRGRFAFRVWQSIGTFILWDLSFVFFRITNVSEAAFTIKQIFTDFSPWILTDKSLLNYGINSSQWSIVIIFMILALLIDIWHERGVRIRETIAGQHLIVRWGIYLCAIISIVLWGVYGIGYDAQSFVYMQF